MRVLICEGKKLANPRLLVILLLFSAVYTSLFISAAKKNWNYVNSSRDVEVHRELIRQFGPGLSPDEWDDFEAFREALADELMSHVQKNPVMQAAGVDTIEDFCACAEYGYKSDASEEEKALNREYHALIRENPVTGSLFFRLQEVDHLAAKKEYGFIFADEEKADRLASVSPAAQKNEAGLARCKEQLMAKSVSLLHNAIPESIDDDFPYLLILAVIWCFTLILPWQIREKLKNIRPLQLTSRLGRRVFDCQAAAAALAGLISGIFLCIVYALFLFRKGVFDFLSCNVSLFMIYDLWFDLSLLQYILLHAAFLLTGSVSAAFLAWLAGRAAANYIAGLGLAIPAAAGLCALTCYLTCKPLHMASTASPVGSLARPLGACVLVFGFAAASCAVVRKDRKRDIR